LTTKMYISASAIRVYPLCGALIAGPATPRSVFSWGNSVHLFEGDVGISLKEGVFADRGSPHTPCNAVHRFGGNNNQRLTSPPRNR
ncbi:MAG: hypothetical protein FWC40_07845, partial [Proteobacteria bacterium]|nr:hypothetical protein [Pseudomonadota bacterium]